ncbi:MAG: chromosome segregation ATPase [Oleiphilaceae bacterium]|jgi:chromosome segregation ATPase
MNINEPSDDVDVSNKYASQWIESLKKKNTALNIIWPLFMSATIVFGLTTFYYFELSESSKSQVTTALSSIQVTKGEVDALSAELNLIRQENINLKENVVLLSDAQITLEQQKGDSVSQLDLSGQMVEALMEKIAALEAENGLIALSLNTTNSLLGKQEKKNQTTNATLASKINSHNKERFTIQKKYKDGQVAFKALMSRQKEMQTEMNRLADLVNQKNNQLTDMTLVKTADQSALNSLELKISTMEKDYKALQASIKLSVEPISMVPKKSDISNVEEEKNSSMNNSDGLEAIHAPVQKPSNEKKKSGTSAAFDFDQISLDN